MQHFSLFSDLMPTQIAAQILALAGSSGIQPLTTSCHPRAASWRCWIKIWGFLGLRLLRNLSCDLPVKKPRVSGLERRLQPWSLGIPAIPLYFFWPFLHTILQCHSFQFLRSCWVLGHKSLAWGKSGQGASSHLGTSTVLVGPASAQFLLQEVEPLPRHF